MNSHITFLILISLCLNSCSKEDQKCCSCLEADNRSDKYKFPVTPGMEEWTKLQSHQDMVDVCQIPFFILQHMCTIGLIDTYLDYPILFTIFAFSNINEGLEQVSIEFNGFHELLLRDDCANKFLLKYKSVDPSIIDSAWTSLEIGKFKQNLQFMELSLSYEPINQRFTFDERKETVRLGLEKLVTKEDNNYSGFSIITNIYLIGKTLEKEEYQPFMDYITRRNNIKLFLNGYLNEFLYSEDVDTIKNFALSFLTQNLPQQ